MPAYATWLEQQRSPAAGRPVSRWFPDPRQAIVVTDYHLDRHTLESDLGGLPGLIVMPAPPRKPIEGVEYATYDPSANPLQWDADVQEAVRGGRNTMAFFIAREQIYGRTLLELHRLGVKRCVFLGIGGPAATRPLAEAARRATRRLTRWNQGAPTKQACQQLLEQAALPRRDPAPVDRDRLRIAHFISTLSSGGAERQLCYAAIGQKQDGHDVTVYVQQPIAGANAHYLPLLEEAGVTAVQPGAHWNREFRSRWQDLGIPPEPLTRLPADLSPPVLDLAAELINTPADVLHCWLDHTNIAGLIAGRLVGVPAVVLSGRSMTPPHCPRLLTPWMLPWYQVAAQLLGVGLTANSRAGAADYADWIGLPAEQVGVLENAFVEPPRPEAAEVQALREELGITPDTPVVTGIFRLDPEKRPLTFLQVVERIRDRIPELRVFLAGRGVLRAEVESAITRRGLDRTVTLLGRRQDIPALLAMSPILLLASDMEGTPNVVLEAQVAGCVPVLTRAGGAADAVQPGDSGLVHDLDDTSGLADSVIGLLQDENRRQEMARKGRPFVLEKYDPARIHRMTLDYYEQVLADPR